MRMKYRYDITMHEFSILSSDNRMVRSFRRLVIPLIAVFCLQTPLATAQSDIPSLGDTARGELTPVAEYQLGKEIMVQIRSDPAYVNDPVLTEYLTNLGNRLVSADPQIRGELANDFSFFAIRDATLNAFALPGGFIGVHTGLLLATQSESELASVLSHEIGHVSQRHIARMLSQQRQDILIPIAATVLAILAAQAGGDAAGAVMMGGQGYAIQKQINFTRDAEKEADRVGFSILKGAGFDTTGMTSFFQRMQTATRTYSDAPSPYLRTHPLTSERIADIEARVRREPYRQHADDLDFYLMRAKARLVQDDSAPALQKAAAMFEEQIKSGSRLYMAAGNYGLALIALQRKEPAKARTYLQQVKKTVGEAAARQSLALDSLTVEILLASGQTADAVREARAATVRFPSSRALAHQYANALYAAKRYDEAAKYLRKQVQMYRDDATLQRQLAKVYDAQGKKALMHMALAESYALSGAYTAALEQLNLARKAGDVTFYDQSVIDAREREWKAIVKENLKERS